MDAITLSRLAVKHAGNLVSESLYRNVGLDTTKPVTFYAVVNERCNVKCRQCEYWRLPVYQDEMSIDEWKHVLLSIKDFVGEFSINFSGGEPYIKKDFTDLLAFGNQNGIHCGVTTNGYCMTPENAAKTVAALPFNVNISVDAPNAEMHDYLRGQPGLFDRLSSGIGHLIAEREKQGVMFPIIIKPTINRVNFRVLPEIVKWAENIGATAVNFQPVILWTKETEEELWIEPADHAEFADIVEQLIEMKASGSPIMNSDKVMQMFVPHFEGVSAPESARPCLVGLRNFWIHPSGDIRLCNDYPVVGNIKAQTAHDIWYGEKAQAVRRETIACDRLCLLTCVSQKTLKDKMVMGLQLLKH
jgi:MoaA/NifB/PqqE/SkfB family radical SAM enzyme